MFDVKQWVVYLVYKYIFCIFMNLFETFMLKRKKQQNGITEQFIYYKRVERQQTSQSLKPGSNEGNSRNKQER